MRSSRQHPPLESLRSLGNECHALEKNALLSRTPYREKHLAAAKPRNDLRGDSLPRFSQSLLLRDAVLLVPATPKAFEVHRVFCPVPQRFEMSLASPVRRDDGHCQFAV